MKTASVLPTARGRQVPSPGALSKIDPSTWQQRQLPMGRKLFRTYLKAYNANARRLGMPEVKPRYSILELWRDQIPTVTSDDLYRDFLEQLVDEMWPDAERGFMTLKASARGHEKVHGTPEQKVRKWGAMQAEVDRVRGANPQWTKANVLLAASKALQVSQKTISRHTHDKGPAKS